jgi:hypothetical protein
MIVPPTDTIIDRLAVNDNQGGWPLPQRCLGHPRDLHSRAWLCLFHVGDRVPDGTRRDADMLLDACMPSFVGMTVR